ncbi:GGDEF domain-containing protein [Acidovorax sp. LjRoot129]|uniref:GGDEF domain-containing protein n=1 Tax=Acidovorax sp. LjRoot129 TaxID=3342260 RepID=UPI003ECD50E1
MGAGRVHRLPDRPAQPAHAGHGGGAAVCRNATPAGAQPGPGCDRHRPLQVNDRHGHEVGDVALRHVAEHLRAACRGSDLAARHGGEEFVVLWDGLDAAAALAAGERLRALVAREPLHAGGALIPMTISMGVAAAGGGDRSFSDLLRRADEALYIAKAGGRNRVEMAG